MEFCVGIDLGSTTTKAVVLDPDHKVLGRGITNSRSNYDVACKVALGEALINARFALIDGRMAAAGVAAERRQQLLLLFELAFREQQYRSQLGALGERLHHHARRQDLGANTDRALDSMLARMTDEAGLLFQVGSTRKSDFFRDLAGSRYVELAEQLARDEVHAFDPLVGLFDKAILETENSTEAVGTFADHARLAMLKAGDPALQQAVAKVMDVDLSQRMCVGTGYGRQRLPFPEKLIRSEILCHGLGAHAMFPKTRTVLDIGGQDTKAIQVDQNGIVTSFQMNDRCAAGCGRYLGYIADEMNLGLHELGPMAGKACRTVRINSTCTVFAGAELRERLSLGEKREDILSGLHRAIILRAMSLLARSGGVEDEFTFTGGVAKNTAAVKALRDLVAENYGQRTLNISPDSIYTGALGAALFAWREVSRQQEEMEVKS
ncbi:MAG: acyl-CoA dehydratase activase [Planctomycetes bacterium]|nr:acyl-CoA dehydratase activase [Planctomycetota bacterium]MCC7395930.1 benzoyl-CoA reductase subunit A [Planctomycetota bacterium]